MCRYGRVGDVLVSETDPVGVDADGAEEGSALLDDHLTKCSWQ
jgi:hypothetical protein